MEGVDYSTARPSPRGLYEAGKRFVVRYGGPGTADKHLTLGEVRALTGAGLSIVANAEGTAKGLKGGYTSGHDWAHRAADHFRACGMPDDRPIYLSADWDVQSGDLIALDAAFDGAAQALGRNRVGIYGGRRAIAWAQSSGAARWFWQTYAWSGTPTVWVPGVHIQQYRNGVTVAGGDCDLNRSMTVDFGQWGVDMERDYGTWAVPQDVGDRPDSVLLAELWTSLTLGHAPYGPEKSYLLRQLDRIEAKEAAVVVDQALADRIATALEPAIERALVRVLGRVGLTVRPRE